MWKYNKGEWSEIYTFAYILSSGILYAADKDLNKLEEIYFPVIKVIREEVAGQPIDYQTGDIIRIYKGEELLKEVNKLDFEEIVAKLYREIPNGSRAFEIDGIEDFFNGVYCEKVKANSTKKEDITFGKQPRFFQHVLRFTAVAASIILVFFIANIHSEHKISEKKNSNLQVLSQAQKPLVDNEICPTIISDEEIDAIQDEVDRHFELMTKEMNKFEQELQN